jgi:hypothetical protein
VADGRTYWWPKDAAWWRREAVVELGEEFGPAGPAVLDWLSCEAKAQNDGGWVKTGVRSCSRGCFVDVVTVGHVLSRAVTLGSLDDFEERDGRFTCRISGWASDNERGRAAVRQAKHRATKPKTPDESRSVTSRHGPSRSVTQQDRTVTTASEEDRDLPTAAERDNDPSYSRLANLLADLIAQNRDDGRRPKQKHVDGWRRDLRLMVEQDGLSLERVEGAIRWSQQDQFWHAQILSAANLRQHYDKLEAKARASRNDRLSKKGRGNTAVVDMLDQQTREAA